MPKWTDYTIKTEPADNDEVMVLDTAGKANKRLGLSALSDWIIEKIANKVFENLQTQNKTILGALNELNSNTSGIKFNGNISRITFRSGSDGISNMYFDLYTNDGKRTTIGFYTDGTNGIQMLKNDTVIWSIKP